MTRFSRRVWRLAAIPPLVSFVFISCKTTQQTRTPAAKPPVAEVPKPAPETPQPALSPLIKPAGEF